MTKQELMETYTAEQLAEMVIEAYEREDYPKIMAININGFPKMFTIKEIEEIVTAYEEIKLCQEQNKQCKTILPSEYLKVLSLNQTVSQLQSKVEKYRKAFEDAKKERDCQNAEYRKKIEELEEYADSLKCGIERKQYAINQIDGIICELFGIAHSGEIYTDDFKELLREKSVAGKTITDFLPTEPIKVADMLINAEGEYECNPIAKALCGTDKGTYRIFDVSELRQIAEHLLVYCNHNEEAEE